MRPLVDRLNYLTKLYDEGHPEISDQEYDDLYFRLLDMETTTNYFFPDSPTRRINYQVVTSLPKVTHNHKMLSLDKTRDLSGVIKFANNQPLVAMTKVDGLTCSLRYVNGRLISAETRGDGIVGEDILHNALTIPTIPHRINFTGDLVVDGEIVCLTNDFEEQFSKDYKNPRNFAAGSIRLLDAAECAKRKLSFIAWDVIKGFEDKDTFSDRLWELWRLQFTVVPYFVIYKDSEVEEVVQDIVNESHMRYIPLDGVVFKFNIIEYGTAQGETAHHFKNAIAYKFYDESYPTQLRDIEWSMGRTGVLTPVAIFDPVDIDGSTVERANLHNVSILHETLNIPWRGQAIEVFKAHMIIPQISYADKTTIPKDSDIILQPAVCPICGHLLQEHEDNNTKILECIYNNCAGKLINRLDYFCGKKGLDIKGLSKATLDKLINWGWLTNLVDIFFLYEHKSEWIKKPGFGEKSVTNILNAIEHSKTCTTVTFITALGIPLLGQVAVSELCQYFPTYPELIDAINKQYDFTELPNFADSKCSSLTSFNYEEANALYTLLNVVEEKKNTSTNTKFTGKKFVITGKVIRFKNRAELISVINAAGGKVVSAISKNVDYLINNDVNSTSAKNRTAKQFGIPIISEEEFLLQLG